MVGDIAVQEPVVTQEAPVESQDTFVETNEEPSAEPETTQATTKSWQERVEEIRQEVGDEEFVKHPVVNARAQSIAAKQHNQWKQEQQQQVELAGRATQWGAWWDSLSPQQKLAHTENDTEQFRNVQAARKILQRGAMGNPETVAQNIVSNFESLLRADDIFSDADFDKLKTEHAANPSEWLASLVKHGVSKAEKRIPELVKAGVTAELARRAKGIESTENGPELHEAGVSTRTKSYTELETAYGEGTATAEENARYLKLRQERR